MPWPKTGATHYHAQSGLPDKGCAIKELVVRCLLPNTPGGVWIVILGWLTLECHGQQPRL